MDDAVRIRDQEMRRTQTFGNFYPFDRFIIHSTSTNFDELVAFDAQIQYACAFYS